MDARTDKAGTRSRHPQSGPMHASIDLGRVAGVEIGINWSWLVIFGLICWSLATAVFPETNPDLGDGAYVAMAAIAALLFFGSLLLHELGHAVVAKREGMEIEGIVLWLFGGVAQFKGLFPSAGAELRIALAGPAVSLAIGVGLLAGAALIPLPAAIDGVATWLGYINVVLLVFNMLPALPLDGGRVLRALIWSRTGDFTRSTRVAAAFGRGFGLFLIFSGVLLLIGARAPGGLWFALIGWFVMAAADAEARFATISTALGSLKVSDAMAAPVTVVPADMTLATFAAGVFAETRHATYPVVAGDEAVGLVGFRDVAAIPRERWEDFRVADVARPLDRLLVLAPDADLGEAAIDLAQDEVGRALVLIDGRLCGLLSMTDLSRLIELHTRSQAPPRAVPPRPGELTAAPRDGSSR